MYVSGHPLLEHADEIEEFTSVDFSDDLMLKKNEIVTVGGMVTKITKKYDRRNRAMAFFEMDCFGGTVEVIAFSDCFEKYEDLICLLYTSPSPRDATLSRMPSSA